MCDLTFAVLCTVLAGVDSAVWSTNSFSSVVS